MKDQGKVPGRDASTPFGFVPVEAIEQPVEVLIFADTNSTVSYFVSNSRPVPIYGTGL